MLLQGRQSSMTLNGMNTRSNIYAHKATSLTSRKVALMPRRPVHAGGFLSSKVTPMRRSLRQTMWQGLFKPSDGTISLNRSVMKSGVTTSRAAPVSEILRTVQSIAPPPKLMDPALRTRRRGAIRCSSPIGESYVDRPRPSTSVGRQPLSPAGFVAAAGSPSNQRSGWKLGLVRGRYAQRPGIPALPIGHRRGSGVPRLRYSHDVGRARSQGNQARLHHLPVHAVRALRKVCLR
jgi:hypothetical protein